MQVTDPEPHKIPLVFYRSASGKEPVRDWLKTLDRPDRLEVGADLQRVQYRWPVGMPLCRALGGGLWEVRTSLPSKTISRVFVCFYEGVFELIGGGAPLIHSGFGALVSSCLDQGHHSLK